MKAILSYHAYQRCLERGIDAAKVVSHIEQQPLFADVKQVVHMGELRIVVTPDNGMLRIKTVYIEAPENKHSGFRGKRRRFLRDRA